MIFSKTAATKLQTVFTVTMSRHSVESTRFHCCQLSYFIASLAIFKITPKEFIANLAIL